MSPGWLSRWPLMAACLVGVVVLPGHVSREGGDKPRQVPAHVVTTTPQMTPAPLPAPTRDNDPTTIPATPRPTRRVR